MHSYRLDGRITPAAGCRPEPRRRRVRGRRSLDLAGALTARIASPGGTYHASTASVTTAPRELRTEAAMPLLSPVRRSRRRMFTRVEGAATPAPMPEGMAPPALARRESITNLAGTSYAVSTYRWNGHLLAFVTDRAEHTTNTSWACESATLCSHRCTWPPHGSREMASSSMSGRISGQSRCRSRQPARESSRLRRCRRTSRC
jgi:hypothetical protein